MIQLLKQCELMFFFYDTNHWPTNGTHNWISSNPLHKSVLQVSNFRTKLHQLIVIRNISKYKPLIDELLFLLLPALLFCRKNTVKYLFWNCSSVYTTI